MSSLAVCGRAYVTVLGTASAALFLPPGLSQTIGLTEFREAHRSELGLALVISGSLLLTQLVITLGKLVTGSIRKRRFSKPEIK